MYSTRRKLLKKKGKKNENVVQYIVKYIFTILFVFYYLLFSIPSELSVYTIVSSFLILQYSYCILCNFKTYAIEVCHLNLAIYVFFSHRKTKRGKRFFFSICRIKQLHYVFHLEICGKVCLYLLSPKVSINFQRNTKKGAVEFLFASNENDKSRSFVKEKHPIYET